MNFARLSDKIVHDLENKGYELVDRAASIAEEFLEGVTSVLEEAAERVSEAKENNPTALTDLWKEFTDSVAEAEAPVDEEPTLLDKAKKDYEWLMNNVSDWEHHKNANYWETYYTNSYDDLSTNARLSEIVNAAAKVRATKSNYSLSDY